MTSRASSWLTLLLSLYITDSFEALCCSTASLLLATGISQTQAQPRGYQRDQALGRPGLEGNSKAMICRGLEGTWPSWAVPQPLSSSKGIPPAPAARNTRGRRKEELRSCSILPAKLQHFPALYSHTWHLELCTIHTLDRAAVLYCNFSA